MKSELYIFAIAFIAVMMLMIGFLAVRKAVMFFMRKINTEKTPLLTSGQEHLLREPNGYGNLWNSRICDHSKAVQRFTR